MVTASFDDVVSRAQLRCTTASTDLCFIPVGEASNVIPQEADGDHSKQGMRYNPQKAQVAPFQQKVSKSDAGKHGSRLSWVPPQQQCFDCMQN